jgi:hypothetical protein
VRAARPPAMTPARPRAIARVARLAARALLARVPRGRCRRQPLRPPLRARSRSTAPAVSGLSPRAQTRVLGLLAAARGSDTTAAARAPMRGARSHST